MMEKLLQVHKCVYVYVLICQLIILLFVIKIEATITIGTMTFIFYIEFVLIVFWTILLGKLKCLDALGRWEEAISLCNNTLEYLHSSDDHNLILTNTTSPKSSSKRSPNTSNVLSNTDAGKNNTSPFSQFSLSNPHPNSNRSVTYKENDHERLNMVHSNHSTSTHGESDDDGSSINYNRVINDMNGNRVNDIGVLPAHLSPDPTSAANVLLRTVTPVSSTDLLLNTKPVTTTPPFSSGKPYYSTKGIKYTSQHHKRLHTKIVVIGARAAWSLNEWNLMNSFVSELPNDNIDACFMRAVLAIYHENYTKSTQLIEQTRKYLDSTITALLAESYGRAYVPLIMVQQCSELEEIAEFKLLLREAGMEDSISGNIAGRSPLDSMQSFDSLGGSQSMKNINLTGLPSFQSSLEYDKLISPVRGLTTSLGQGSLNNSNHYLGAGNNPPMSPRTRSTVKLSDFSTDDSSTAITNEQSQQFSLQLEARYVI